MEEMMDILNSARNILVSVDEEYERVVRQYEYLLDKKNRTEEECNRVAEQLQSLTELEEHWFSDKLWSEEPISITGSYRGKEDKWISSLESFQRFCKLVEESSQDSSILIDFVKELRAKKRKLNDEALLLYKARKQQEETE
ncbi:hypothetical protein GAYE_PCTG36G1009 [Galdieria yellowstonensis]|uniref:Uncharacterized protein n=1 Tax=Galdieria yellowstonensis TaxID=3028027 RepID=A0AAV9I752_9RHOD|nr:hypothetical protein GAYE_PCTG36G1009 [Galdieria yellowstonensis]